MIKFLPFVVLIFVLVHADVIEYTLSLSYADYSADGYTRPTILINGSSPGPEIRCRHGDLVVIKVTNDLFYEGAAIHVHGLHNKGSPQFDGVAYGTQWPILPGKEFTYRYNITNSPGTYWYHAHYQLQSQAVYGAFIIEDDFPVYTYDDERTILLSDWYHASDVEQLVGLMSPTFKWIGDPQSLLLNGKGRYNCSLSGEVDTACHSSGGEYSVISVEPNLTYRFRFIGATSLVYLRVDIEGHDMTIIESDSMYVEPYLVDNLEINSGERYSVLIRTDQQIGNFKISIGVRWRKTGPVGYGYLHYNGSSIPDVKPLLNSTTNILPSLPPLSLLNPPSTPEWVTTRLKPLAYSHHYSKVPQRVTKTFVLTGKQSKVVSSEHSGNQTYLKWLVNDAFFEPNYDVPLLMAAYDGDLWASINDESKSLVYRIERGDVVDIVLQNVASLNGVCEEHPWHLHGHHFWVIGSGPGAYKDYKHNKSLFNLDDPVMKDTVTVYPYDFAFFQTFNSSNAGQPCGWKVLRFVADNPGIWNMHCHITAHMHMGMQVFFAEAVDEIQSIIDSNISNMGMGDDQSSAYLYGIRTAESFH